MSYDTISRFIRNLHVLQDSRKRLGGQVESWQGLWCWILIKLSQKLLTDDPYHLTPTPGSSGITPGSSGTSIFSKTPGRNLEDNGVLMGFWCWILMKILHEVISWYIFNMHVLLKTPLTPDDSRKIHGEKVEYKRVMSFT